MMDVAKREELLRLLDERIPMLITPEDPYSAHDLDVFRSLYAQFISEPSKIDWANWQRIPAEMEIPYEKLPVEKDEEIAQIQTILARIVVIKLNGGLGTTMGCRGPKSLIRVREEGGQSLTFLDFALQQNKSAIPLILMNSFNTAEATQRVLEALKDRTLTERVRQFSQSRCPKIFADSLLPVPDAHDNCAEEGWYPPGHGNVFASMAETGLLDELLAEGRDIAFISNIDNTAAVVDLRLARAMTDGLADYLMEVTPRTAADVKGGTLIQIDGRPMHLECPQVPVEHIDEFCSLRTFKMFNTNNIWVNLREVRSKLPNLKMEILANEKRLSNSSQKVIQLETSIGGAIRNFPGRSLSVVVNRARFLPVKNTCDLFRVMSPDLYEFESRKHFILRQKMAELPIVKLSSEFDRFAEFRHRIPQIPILQNIKFLRIQGDVTLGRYVQFVGENVEICAPAGESLLIADYSVIQGVHENGGDISCGDDICTVSTHNDKMKI